VSDPIKRILDEQGIGYKENDIWTIVPVPCEHYCNISGKNELLMTLENKAELASSRLEACLYEINGGLISITKLAISLLHGKTRALTYEIYDRENGLADVYVATTVPWSIGDQAPSGRALMVSMVTMHASAEKWHGFFRSIINTGTIDFDILGA
jgi:hypothetical protein